MGLAALVALRQALVRRAVRISTMHANRAFTHEPNGIPMEDAKKFPGLISMSPHGDYVLSPEITSAIADLRKQIHDDREARARSHKRPHPRSRSTRTS